MPPDVSAEHELRPLPSARSAGLIRSPRSSSPRASPCRSDRTRSRAEARRQPPAPTVATPLVASGTATRACFWCRPFAARPSSTPARGEVPTGDPSAVVRCRAARACIHMYIHISDTAPCWVVVTSGPEGTPTGERNPTRRGRHTRSALRSPASGAPGNHRARGHGERLEGSKQRKHRPLNPNL